MTIDDLTCMDISQGMLDEAEQVSQKRAINKGDKTKAAFDDRGMGDIVGDLAEQVVDISFNDSGIAHKSYREEDSTFGDICDIEYEEDLIDVKGTRGEAHNKYFYNKEFLVFADQLNKIKEGKKEITHFCFVQVDTESKHACIYGVINVKEFIDVSKEVNLRYNNYGIRAWELIKYGKLFRDYLYRVN